MVPRPYSIKHSSTLGDCCWLAVDYKMENSVTVHNHMTAHNMPVILDSGHGLADGAAIRYACYVQILRPFLLDVGAWES